MGGLEAHPTTKFTLCGTGILPVLENGAISQFQPTLAMRRGINSPAGLWVSGSLLIPLANRKNTIAQFHTICQNFLPRPPIRGQNIV